MIFIKKKLELTDQQTQTNIKIPFEIQEDYKKLVIHFDYGPDFSSDEAAQSQVQEAIQKFVFDGSPKEDYIVANYLPIENFITLSLSKNGNYLGGHHNKAKEQTVSLSSNQASLGFWPTTIEPSKWELQLNCHCIASKKVEVNIRIEGENI